MERIINLAKQGLVIYGAVETALIRYYHVLLGMALGTLIGILFVPVYFRPNAVPAQMDNTYREQWIKDTANGYQYVVNNADTLGDAEAAAQLRARAEEEAKAKLTDVGATPGDIDALIRNNENDTYLVASLTSIRPYAEDVRGSAAEQKEQYSEGPPGAIVRALTTLGIFALFGILGLLVTIVFKLFDIPFLKQIRNLINPREEDPSLAAAKARKKEREQAAKMKTVFDSPPVVQFTTSYLSGDNYYDDSFAIEVGDPDDHKRPFLGECGAGISKAFKETGRSDKQVVATEVFLFDKVDGATITNVLMSETAYQDEELRAELAPRGALQLARVGETFVLETQTLQAQVTVLSVEYAEAEKPNYVLSKVTVEIAVWQKEGAPGAVDLSGKGSDDDFVMPKPIIDFPLDDEPVAPPPVRQEVRPLTPADFPPQPPIQQQQPMTPPQQQMPPQHQPIAPPPTQQPTQGMPPQIGDLTQPRQPFPAQQPQQQPYVAQPPVQQQQMPPQQGQRPPAPPPQQGQRPPVPQQGGRPPIPQQGGQRPPIPQQGQGNRPPVPQQGQGSYPPLPPQRRADDDSPFGDTGDFNL